MDIFTLKGPEFLAIFISVEAIAMILAYLARRFVLLYECGSSTKPARIDLDAYHAAYLNGGCKHLFLTILTALEHQGSIKVDLLAKTVEKVESPPADAADLEKVVAAKIDREGTTFAAIYDSVKNALEERVGEHLIEAGLVPSKAQASLAKLLSSQLVLAPVAFLAMPKFLIGISHHKPVFFLIVLSLLSAIAAICFFCNEIRATVKGEKKLASWKKRSEALKTNFQYCASSLETKDITLGYALFAGFAFTLFNPLPQALAATSGNNIWSYSPGGYQGSSGSCGSSCGGGCGGGCGGCGG